MQTEIFPVVQSDSYTLVDSGNGRKLERFGSYTIVRPDPRAIWETKAPESAWRSADAVFVGQTGDDDRMIGEWEVYKRPPEPWEFRHGKMVLKLRSGEFKNIGVFPEQATNWGWLTRVIDGKPLKILNLFAYTGGATIVSALSGASVTHVDSVKSVVSWASDNAQKSDNSKDRIRWIVDDAVKFVEREVRRGAKYDGIIMDPPRFGRGSGGEVWKLAEGLPNLMRLCREILASSPTFFLLNAYTADLSPIAIHNVAADLLASYGGHMTTGELALVESHGGRFLPAGVTVRWTA